MSRRLLPCICLVVTTLVATGCSYKRVALPDAPPLTAPQSDRVAYHKKHQAVGQYSTTVSSTSVQSTPAGAVASTGVQSDVKFLQLANGTRVEDARDLVPAVGPDTPAGKAGVLAGEAHDVEVLLERAMLATVLSPVVAVSLAGVVGGAWLATEMSREARPLEMAVLGGIGGGLGAIAGLPLGGIGVAVLVPFWWSASDDAENERATAFMLYNASLSEHLGLQEPTSSE